MDAEKNIKDRNWDKLAPDADIGEGLSVHYSGGANLSEDIQDWLEINGIKK